jgi:hypothetical protein
VGCGRGCLRQHVFLRVGHYSVYGGVGRQKLQKGNRGGEIAVRQQHKFAQLVSKVAEVGVAEVGGSQDRRGP